MSESATLIGSVSFNNDHDMGSPVGEADEKLVKEFRPIPGARRSKPSDKNVKASCGNVAFVVFLALSVFFEYVMIFSRFYHA